MRQGRNGAHGLLLKFGAAMGGMVFVSSDLQIRKELGVVNKLCFDVLYRIGDI